jgi:DNA-binding NtrC family response regulator
MVNGAVRSREFSRTAKKSPSLRVLIVDDEPLIRWSLAETLGERGHQVVEGGDACAARAAVDDPFQTFDVIVLDYRLPDSADLSLLASILERSPRTQIILMTAFGTPEVIHRAMDLGAFRVVNKPFEIRDMADLVAEAGAAPRASAS